MGRSDGIGLAIGRVAVAIRATRATPSIRVTDGAGVDIDSATGATICRLFHRSSDLSYTGHRLSHY